MTVPGLGTLWRTVRHLRFRQVRYQLAYRLRIGGPPVPRALKWRPAVPKVQLEKTTRRSWYKPGASGDFFDFNNEARAFTGDWNDPGARKLWLYNLHYMAWLFDIHGEGAPQKREQWILRWVRENPPAAGNGWEPYPTSLRLFNWCKHYALARTVPPGPVLESMSLQTGRLLNRLEFHLDANHLMENLLALTFVGLFLDREDSTSRRALHRIDRLMREELQAQYLPDGGHYERSPMYHAILLERMLDLLNVWPGTDDPLPGIRSLLEPKARAGLDWLDTMTVGGRFSLFNDSAYDTAPEADSLLEFGNRLLGREPLPRVPLRALASSGYFRAESGPLTLIFDAGDLAPDHQMGHAQGDMLSFCLWADDVPLLVHPGNYEYVGGALRAYCRSTAAHNTAAPDGAEQAEWWGSHRVGRRGRILDASGERDASGAIRLRGRHDGYAHRPGAPLHAREIRLEGSSLAVLDSFSAAPRALCRARYHFHPDCAVRLEADGTVTARLHGGVLRLSSDSPVRLEASLHCPEFGLSIPSVAAVIETADPEIRATLTWNPVSA